jgi:hypothetical protein
MTKFILTADSTASTVASFVVTEQEAIDNSIPQELRKAQKCVRKGANLCA